MVSRRNIALIIAGIVWSILFAYGAYRYQTSHTASPLTALAPWGAMATAYAFFALSSCGVTFATASRLLGRTGDGEATRRGLWLALALVVPAAALIFAHITHISHSPWIYRDFNPDSRIAWDGALFIIYSALLIASLVYVIHTGDDEVKGLGGRALLTATLLTAFVLAYNVSMAFGWNLAVPGWFAAPLGALGLAAALLLGSAWLAIAAGKPLGKLMAAGAVALGFMAAWALVSQEAWGLAAKAASMLAAGKAAPLYWTGWVLAVAAPIALGLYAAAKGSKPAAFAGGVAAIIGVFAMLHGFAVAGQVARLEMLPSYKALGLAAVGTDYASKAFHWLAASGDELAASIGGFGVWLLVYSIGDTVLALNKGEKPKRVVVFR